MVKIKGESKTKDYYYALILGGIAALALILVPLYVLRPIINSNSDLSVKIQGKEEVVAKLEKKLTALKDLSKKEAEVKKDYERIISALPDTIDESYLLRLGQVLPSRGGVFITEYNFSAGGTAGGTTTTAGTPGATAAPAGISDVPITLKILSTSYESAKSFFDVLNNSLRIIQVKGFDLNYAQGGGIEISFTASVFYKGSAAAVPATSAP